MATEVPADPTAPDGDAAAAGGRGDGGIEALLLEGDGAGAGAGAGGGSRGTGAEPPAMLYTPYHAYTMRNAIQVGGPGVWGSLGGLGLIGWSVSRCVQCLCVHKARCRGRQHRSRALTWPTYRY